MKRVNRLVKPFAVLSSCVLLASCGGGGSGASSDFTDFGGGGGSYLSGSSSYINLKSVSISETNHDGVITPNEEFYIYWNADFGGYSMYHIEFFTLPDNNVPDGGNGDGFLGLNCGGSGTFLDCSKGAKCIYTKETDDLGQTNYYLDCYWYSTFSGSWEEAKKTKIDPYTTNYIGADAETWSVNSDGTLNELHSKKAIPITFGF